ncbi:MAG: hypothetical protein ACXADL_05860 [Candidatus Thorarchaeota archaeon]|jgi:hypothetical protein
MTCYFRHIKSLFEEIGINVTPDNKREIDKRIHDFVGVDYKDCSKAWKGVKKKLAEDRDGLAVSLRKVLSTPM